MTLPSASTWRSLAQLPLSRLSLPLRPLFIPLLLLCWCGFLFFYGINQGDLLRTEGLRARIAAECLQTGNWLIPTLYGQPLLTKPPGIYAAIAMVSWPFGEVTTWSARLPSALAATALVFLFYWYFRRLMGTWAGLAAAFILPASAMWLDKAPSAEIDMLQTAWVGAAILFFLRGLEEAETGQNYFGWWALSLLCVAGGFLTKWTAPAFFYGCVITLLWWRGSLRLLWGRSHLTSALLAGLVCLGWVALAVHQAGWETFFDTVYREASQHLLPGQRAETIRQMSADHQSRLGYWGELVLHPFKILAATLPWSLLALLSLRPSFARSLGESGRRALQGFHCWVWPSVLLWSILPQHSLRHSFPLFPGIAGLAALVCIVWLVPMTDIPRLRVGLTNWRGWVFVSLLAAWLVTKVVFVEVEMARRARHRQPRARGEQLASLVPAGQPLFLCMLKDEGMMFYYGREVRRLPGWGDVPAVGQTIFGIMKESEWPARPAGRPAQILGRLQDQQGQPILLVAFREMSPVIFKARSDGLDPD